MFDRLGLTAQVEYTKANVEGMHPGRTADIRLNGERIGFIGQVHPNVQKELDLKDTLVFELFLKAVLDESATEPLQYGQFHGSHRLQGILPSLLTKKQLPGY